MNKKENLNDILFVKDILSHMKTHDRLFVILNHKFHIGPQYGFTLEYIWNDREYTRFLVKAFRSIVLHAEVVPTVLGDKGYKLYIEDKDLEKEILEYENGIYEKRCYTIYSNERRELNG